MISSNGSNPFRVQNPERVDERVEG